MSNITYLPFQLKSNQEHLTLETTVLGKEKNLLFFLIVIYIKKYMYSMQIVSLNKNYIWFYP